MYSLYVTATSTTTATPSRSHFQAPFSIHRRTLNVTASPTITNIVMPTDNLVVTSEFNLFFSVMSPSSTCDLKVNTQAIVCINDQIATCGNDGKYKLQACPLGQKCRAVPLDRGQTGLSIQCVPPNDGANIAQLTSRSATPTASASLPINNGTSPGQGSGPVNIKITTTKTAAPSPLSGDKLNSNKITKSSLQTSAKILPVVVNSSQAPSTAIRLFATTVSTPTAPTLTPTISSAEISSTKSEPPILQIIPVTNINGENAAQK